MQIITGDSIIGYAAKEYKKPIPLTLKKIEINIPTLLPTIPMDDKKSTATINSSIFKNTNFPKISSISFSNSIEVSIFHQYTKLDTISKGQRLMLMCPSIQPGDILAIPY